MNEDDNAFSSLSTMPAVDIAAFLKRLKTAIPRRDGFMEPIFEIDEQVERAVDLAFSAHENQRRETVGGKGEPYIHHILAVTLSVCQESRLVLNEINPSDLLCGAILHDAYEDFKDVRQVVRTQFTDTVQRLLEAQKKVSSRTMPKRTDRDQILAENICAFGPPAILIKCCDLIDNMIASDSVSKEMRVRIARRVDTLYLPIARDLPNFQSLYERMQRERRSITLSGRTDNIQDQFEERLSNIATSRSIDRHDVMEVFCHCISASDFVVVRSENLEQFLLENGMHDIDIILPDQISVPSLQILKPKRNAFNFRARIPVLIFNKSLDRHLNYAVALVCFFSKREHVKFVNERRATIALDYLTLKSINDDFS